MKAKMFNRFGVFAHLRRVSSMLLCVLSLFATTTPIVESLQLGRKKMYNDEMNPYDYGFDDMMDEENDESAASA